MPLDDGPHPALYVPTEQSEVRDDNQIPPFTVEEVIQGADINQINSMLRGLSKDLRAFIIKFGLNPDAPDLKDMEDAATAILALGGDGGGTVVTVMKAVDETETNNAAVQDDDELKLAVAAGEKWVVDFTIEWSTNPGFGGPGLRWTIDLGSGAPDISDWATIDSPSIMAFGVENSSFGSATKVRLTLRALLDNTNGDATNLKFRWAQSASDPIGVTVHKGSAMVAWKQ